jgi:Pyruvate:ferredoxin oxidoreductase and related 2-oxoacid:ferredoxin oxidoreductases, gamma subunit
MNRPSLDKFQPKLVDGGIQLVNSSLVDPELVEKGGRIRTVLVPANELADQVGNARAVNTIMLGAYVAATGMVKLETVEGCLSAVMPAKIVELNVRALRLGAEYARKQLAAAPGAKNAPGKAPGKAPAKAPVKAAAKAKKPAAKKPVAKKK